MEPKPVEIPPIAWSDFSWEAFATLATGFAAIGGAVLVGLRQIEISRTQADNEKLRMRMELFERRLDVFNTVKNISATTLHPSEPIPTELYVKFRRMLRGLEFLFDKELSDHIDQIWRNIDELAAPSDGVNMVRTSGGSDKAAWSELNAAFKGLAARFRPWLDLSDVR